MIIGRPSKLFFAMTCFNNMAQLILVVFRFSRQFEESEKKRIKAEQLRQELKHKKQWDDLRGRNEAALAELEQLQVIN